LEGLVIGSISSQFPKGIRPHPLYFERFMADLIPSTQIDKTQTHLSFTLSFYLSFFFVVTAMDGRSTTTTLLSSQAG
jgi:hypothetical protein